MDTIYDVIVVGAGISGLFTAQQLVEHGIPNILVLEANATVGGRVKQLRGFVEWPVELGAEFIHGEDSSLFLQWIKKNGWTLQPSVFPTWWYLHRSKSFVGPDEKTEFHESIKKVMKWIEHPDEKDMVESGDITLLDYLKSVGATEEQIEMAQVLANDFGGDFRNMGMNEIYNEEESNRLSVLDRSMDHILATVSHPLHMIGVIQCCSPVTKIQYEYPMVQVTLKDNSVLRCHKVVVTASLGVLKSNKIEFSPPLPIEKQGAISRLRMGNAIKVILKFKSQIWPSHIWDLCCPGFYFPEIWMKSVGTCHTIVCFRCESEANPNVPDIHHFNKAIEQIDEIFSTPTAPLIGSHNLTGHHIMNWSKEEFVLGGYSFPSFGVLETDRHTLGAPIDDSVYFAGEATCPTINSAMHGAHTSSFRVVHEILSSIKRPKL